MSNTRFREIDVGGSFFEMGQQIGEAARDEIGGFAAIALERMNQTICVSREKAFSIARQSFAFVESYAPHLIEELKGMAHSSGVSIDDLMMLQIRNQLRADADAGCTSFALKSPTGQTSVVGQNWDNDPALTPYTVVLKRRPKDKPALMTITQAGLIAYIGLNDVGIGICLNTLPAPSRPLGVPHYFTVRGIYETTSLSGAVDAVKRAQRAIPANIILSTPQGPADLEVTVDDVHVITDQGAGVVTHTNHCEHPDLQPINGQFPDLIQSRARKVRIQKLFGNINRPMVIDSLKNALRDHENHPRSICRHPNEDAQTGYWATVFSVLIEPDTGCMHISRGNPCEQPYEVYSLTA